MPRLIFQQSKNDPRNGAGKRSIVGKFNNYYENFYCGDHVKTCTTIQLDKSICATSSPLGETF